MTVDFSNTKLSWRAVIATTLILSLMLAQDSFAAPSKRALLIAIDEYQLVSDLNGTGNDVELMRSVLTGKFDFPPENIRILSNEEATRKGILSAVRNHLIEPSEPGDIVVLHYSGHGSQMIDVSGDEIDGFDETIVPHDARTEGVFDISDDELNAILNELGEKTDNVTVIFDSCNSGSATRGAMVRTVARDTRIPPAVDPRAIAQDSATIRPLSAEYVLISGARYNEFANETRFEGKTYGAMTYHLANALMAAGESFTYREVMDEVKSKVNARFSTQHPQLEGAGMDTAVFGDQIFVATPYVLVEPSGSNRAVIRAGLEFGLSKDSELNVYSPGTRDFETATPVAKVRITSADVGRSKAHVIEGRNIQPHSRATMVDRAFGDIVLPVWIDAEIDAVFRSRLENSLSVEPSIELISNEADSRVRVVRDTDSVVLESADQVALSPSVPIRSDDAVERLVQQTQNWARWYSLLDLNNPNPSFDIDLKLRRDNDPEGVPNPEFVVAGTKVHYTVTNNSEETLFIYALVLSADGSISVLYPTSGAEEGLPPREVLKQKDIEPFVPEGRNSITDVLKVIATNTPINPRIFQQAAVRGAGHVEVSDDPFERLLAHSSLGATRGFKSPGRVELSSWATTQISVETRQPRSRSVSFAVHTDAVGAATRGPTTRVMCGVAVGQQARVDCIEAAPLSDDGDVFEVSANATRGGVRGVFSPGQAFEDAYDLRDELGVARVEPLIEADVSNNDDVQPRIRSSVGDDPHDPLAEADELWSLKYVLANEAHEKVRDKHGANEGSEAAGVLIAHPDTGYRRHPEIWEAIGGQRPVLNSAGVDYVEPGTDPFDPLDDTGLLSNPGHGTGSGSVIVSPQGCQLEDSENCVSGVAPGAQLVPLRVHTSVVLLNQRNLVKALNDFADDKLGEATPMASIAMGGPPSWALWKAAKKSEKNGKLIVAAAGNRVGTVVWPARFRSTIAVAAVNIRCKPWQGSSRGRAVDIASPGESVWRATVDKNTEENLIGMGRGTTFATGTTSGAAALWLAYHSGDPELQQLKEEGKIVAAFRHAAQESSWRPDIESGNQPAERFCDENLKWRSRKFGAGILNASKLLDLPLDAGATRSTRASTLTELPLVDSLYPDQSNFAVIVADFRRLFEIEPNVDLETIAYFESEIIFHYANNEDVRNRYDAIIEGSQRDIDYAMLRDALIMQDLSKRLRAALSI